MVGLADFRVGGIQWQADGTYTIKITYTGNMEKSIEYEESLSLQSISESTPKPTPNHESTVFEKFPSNFITLKFQIFHFLIKLLNTILTDTMMK